MYEFINGFAIGSTLFFIIGITLVILMQIIYPSLFFASVWVEITPEFEEIAFDIFKDKENINVIRYPAYINVNDKLKNEFVSDKVIIRKRVQFMERYDAQNHLDNLVKIIQNNDLKILNSGIC